MRGSLNTDHPAMFATDLGHVPVGLDPRDFYDAGMNGALCTPETRARLGAVAAEAHWDA